jgi:hypothetical protein
MTTPKRTEMLRSEQELVEAWSGGDRSGRVRYKKASKRSFEAFCGADGGRTHDLRRDRPAF